MGNNSQQDVIGSMFIGTAVSFTLHGITSCQVVWYFRAQHGRSSKSMKALVLFVWLAELLNCIFIFFGFLHMFVSPAITEASPCRYWTGQAQALTSAMCTFSVEGFFIMRVWKLSEHKYLIALVFIPYLIGYAFGFAQIGRSFRVRCHLEIADLNPVFVFGTYGARLFADGVIVVSMCYMLRTRSVGFTRHANTIKIVRWLILWSVSTGMLTWLFTLLFLTSYLDLLSFSGFGIYYVRGGLYANAMLTQLNERVRFREMAEATMPLTINLDTMSSSDRRTDHESQPPEHIAE